MTGRNRAIWAVAVGLFISLLAGGCQQEQANQDKQARLVAAQNLQLHEELDECRTRVRTLAENHAKAMERRDQELAQCRARNKALQNDLQQGVAERVKDVTDAVITENAALREKIRELLAEIEKLRANDG
jgi:dynactin complex subunit